MSSFSWSGPHQLMRPCDFRGGWEGENHRVFLPVTDLRSLSPNGVEVFQSSCFCFLRPLVSRRVIRHRPSQFLPTIYFCLSAGLFSSCSLCVPLPLNQSRRWIYHGPPTPFRTVTAIAHRSLENFSLSNIVKPGQVQSQISCTNSPHQRCRAC